MLSLPRGLCIPLPTAIAQDGSFDAPSQERLLRFLAASKPAAILSAPSLENLAPELSRKANEAAHFAALGPALAMGISAASVEGLLGNLEHAIKLGAQSLVLDPLACADSGDPVALFHRHLIPRLDHLGKSLPILLDDGGGERRLRTRDLKQLSRLDAVVGLLAGGSPKVVGNYLKGARHYKARHEFGVYLSNAELIFPLFMPVRNALGALRDHWMRLWMGAEHPQGIAPLSAVLFPAAWNEAWNAALAGDAQRMTAFARAFEALGSLDLPKVRAALLEEGIFSSDRPPEGPGQGPMEDGARRAWLFEYFSSKKELSKLQRQTAAPAPKAGPAQEAPHAGGAFDVVGIGGVVLDEFRRVPVISGGNSKIKVLGRPERLPGGVMLNQLSWLSTLGFRTALFGKLGADAEGDWLRQEAAKRGVDASRLVPSREPTEVARIFVDQGGEREIYLESGACCATKALDLARFEPLIKGARMVSTEISLLPLSAVLKVIDLSRKHGVPVAVDLDIPISQATAKGGLGSKAEMEAILRNADYVKTSQDIAAELRLGARGLHKKWRKKKGCWVGLSMGVRGSELSDGGKALRVPAFKAPRGVDSTGCGDAYMAGLLAGTLLKLPLKDIGALASAAGAACASSLGAAAPLSGARAAVLRHLKGRGLRLGPEPMLAGSAASSEGSDFLRVATAELQKFSSRFAPGAFDEAKALVRQAEAQGRRLHVTGVGKPEYVAGYVASSYSSTGTPAFFLHATEAGHGASGQVSPGDVVIAISNSGETEELKGAVSTVRKNGAKVIGVSGKPQSWLGRNSDVFLFAGVDREGDTLNLAPRSSVLAEIMVLSALGVELQQDKKFTAEDFRSFHPGGTLGKRA
jgi:D-arabinose 5-phosphate isomerase GutQ/sugar/nucleoside kinase (ribokinase family)